MKLIWNVFKHNFNSGAIEIFNIFNHWCFKEDVERSLKKCNTKEEFSEELNDHLLYYYWSKCEYEIVITSFPTSIIQQEYEKLTLDYDKYIYLYKHSPYKLYIDPDVQLKVDIYSQVMLNFDVFVDYIWSHKKDI